MTDPRPPVFVAVRELAPRVPPEAYEAAKAAMVQREAVPGRPEDGPYPASLDEVAEAITDAVWPLATAAGRAEAARDVETAMRAESDRLAAPAPGEHQAPIACPYAPTGNAIACPKAWQTDMSAHVVVHPQPPAIRMHRCAYVGAHTAHMCPCGSYLVGGPA